MTHPPLNHYNYENCSLGLCVGKIIIRDIPTSLENLDGDDICTQMGFKQSNVEYMIADDILPIDIDTEGCTANITIN